MNNTEHKNQSLEEQKRKIRERYKGVDPDSLDVIPAAPKKDIYQTEEDQRVAVYARVSTDNLQQTSSYELQKNYYEDLVNRNPHWKLVDIYADEGISGTSLKHRDAFVRMIADCKAGKIDVIITKSVSRFARNILDCVGYIRELQALNPPVGVIFEAERLYTLDDKNEMSLSFLATLAQEESHSKSVIMNGSVEMRFKQGIFLTPVLLGYNKDEDGNLIINEGEEDTVRLIFFMYLYGYGTTEIANTLTALEKETKRGNKSWSASSILRILQNERYCGDVLARKTFTPSYLDHKSKKNKMDRNQYYQRDHHDPIISRDDFIAVQQRIRHSKRDRDGFLPHMAVITNGILRGYIPINPRWAGFTADDYLTAYSSLESEIVQFPAVTYQAEAGSFDLRGYEIVPGQFLSGTRHPTITISKGKLSFSKAAIKKLDYPYYIDLLVHPSEKCLAVRSSKKENRTRIQWAQDCKQTINPKYINGTAFLPAIFELFEWDTEYTYKITGSYLSKDGESIITFNASDAEVLIPAEKITQTNELLTGKRQKHVRAFPLKWAEDFGPEYYDRKLDEQKAQSVQDWNTSSIGIPFKNTELNITEKDEVERVINDIISGSKGS